MNDDTCWCCRKLFDGEYWFQAECSVQHMILTRRGKLCALQSAAKDTSSNCFMLWHEHVVHHCCFFPQIAKLWGSYFK